MCYCCGGNLSSSLTRDVIYIKTFLKIISSGNSSSVETNILVSPNFLIYIISLIMANTLSNK